MTIAHTQVACLIRTSSLPCHSPPISSLRRTRNRHRATGRPAPATRSCSSQCMETNVLLSPDGSTVCQLLVMIPTPFFTHISRLRISLMCSDSHVICIHIASPSSLAPAHPHSHTCRSMACSQRRYTRRCRPVPPARPGASMEPRNGRGATGQDAQNNRSETG